MRPVAKHAAVHDREDAGVARLLRGSFIDDAVLQPQRRHLQANAVLDDAGNVFGPAEYVDHVDGARTRDRGIQVWPGAHAEDLRGGRDSPARCGNQTSAVPWPRCGSAGPASRKDRGWRPSGCGAGRRRCRFRGVLEHGLASGCASVPRNNLGGSSMRLVNNLANITAAWLICAAFTVARVCAGFAGAGRSRSPKRSLQKKRRCQSSNIPPATSCCLTRWPRCILAKIPLSRPR